jgi:hypothetical protein
LTEEFVEPFLARDAHFLTRQRRTDAAMDAKSNAAHICPGISRFHLTKRCLDAKHDALDAGIHDGHHFLDARHRRVNSVSEGERMA